MAATTFLPSKSCLKSSYAQPYPGTIWSRELWGGGTVELNETKFWVSLILFFTLRDKRDFPLIAPVRVISSLLSGGWGESGWGRKQAEGVIPAEVGLVTGVHPSWYWGNSEVHNPVTCVHDLTIPGSLGLSWHSFLIPPQVRMIRFPLIFFQLKSG